MELYNTNPEEGSESALVESDISIRFPSILRNMKTIMKPLLIGAIIDTQDST